MEALHFDLKAVRAFCPMLMLLLKSYILNELFHLATKTDRRDTWKQKKMVVL